MDDFPVKTVSLTGISQPHSISGVSYHQVGTAMVLDDEARTDLRYQLSHPFLDPGLFFVSLWHWLLLTWAVRVTRTSPGIALNSSMVPVRSLADHDHQDRLWPTVKLPIWPDSWTESQLFDGFLNFEIICSEFDEDPSAVFSCIDELAGERTSKGCLCARPRGFYRKAWLPLIPLSSFKLPRYNWYNQ